MLPLPSGQSICMSFPSSSLVTKQPATLSLSCITSTWKSPGGGNQLPPNNLAQRGNQWKYTELNKRLKFYLPGKYKTQISFILASTYETMITYQLENHKSSFIYLFLLL